MKRICRISSSFYFANISGRCSILFLSAIYWFSWMTCQIWIRFTVWLWRGLHWRVMNWKDYLSKLLLPTRRPHSKKSIMNHTLPTKQLSETWDNCRLKLKQEWWDNDNSFIGQGIYFAAPWPWISLVHSMIFYWECIFRVQECRPRTVSTCSVYSLWCSCADRLIMRRKPIESNEARGGHGSPVPLLLHFLHYLCNGSTLSFSLLYHLGGTPFILQLIGIERYFEPMPWLRSVLICIGIDRGSPVTVDLETSEPHFIASYTIIRRLRPTRLHTSVRNSAHVFNNSFGRVYDEYLLSYSRKSLVLMFPNAL